MHTVRDRAREMLEILMGFALSVVRAFFFSFWELLITEVYWLEWLSWCAHELSGSLFCERE